MADSTTMQQHTSFSEFVSSHQGLVIGGGVVAVLILAGMFMSKKTSVPVTTSTGDLSGLSGGTGGQGIVYVPTQTTFSTQNIRQGALSNDPNLTQITSPVNIGTTTINKPTTTTTTTTNTGETETINQGPTTFVGNPPRANPPPAPRPNPAPKQASKSLRWDQRHSVRGGETLSSLASSYTRTLRAQGMPGNMTLTWHDIYAHNVATITKYANQHGFRTDVWNWIFPGETLIVPRWG